MRRIRPLAAAVFALLLAQPAAATLRGSFFKPDLQVAPLSQTDFEVLEGPSEGARTYWCAAAFHATFTLGRDSGRIYLTRALGPSVSDAGRRGVTFSIATPAEPTSAVSLSLERVAEGLLIGQALQFCRDSDLEADQ